MSKANITGKQTVNGRLQVTFETHDGSRTYSYSARVAKQIQKGKDPANFSGKLVEHRKAQ